MAHNDWSGEDPNPSHGYNSEFKFLKILNICYVDVTVNTLQYFLCNRPFPEWLIVFGAKSLVNLRAVGSSIALKYLVIYASVHLKRIEIRDANLVSFIYQGSVIDLRLGNVPSLVEVSILIYAASIQLPLYHSFTWWRYVFVLRRSLSKTFLLIILKNERYKHKLKLFPWRRWITLVTGNMWMRLRKLKHAPITASS